MVLPIGAAFAGRCMKGGLGFRLHQPFGRNADHFPQKVVSKDFSKNEESTILSLVIGLILGLAIMFATQFYPKIAPVTANRPACAGLGGRYGRPISGHLHRQLARDLRVAMMVCCFHQVEPRFLAAEKPRRCR